MIIDTQGIVLRALKYGDRKLIVDLLTRNEGRLSCVATIAAARRGGIRKSVFGLLNILDVTVDMRPGRQLHAIRSVRIGVPYVSIPFDARKLSISLFLSEFVYHGTRSEQCNPALYAFVLNSLQWLDACEGNFANFHLVFMMHMSRFVGFFPNADDYRDGDLFDLRAATFTSVRPLHPDFLPPADAARVCSLLRMQYATMRLFRMSHDERNRIADVILHYYRLHVPSFPELRSLDILKTLWG